MNRIIIYLKLGILSLVFLSVGCAQNTTGISVQNPEFDHHLNRILRMDVPVISVDSLYQNKSSFFLLDTRLPEEYKVSHIREAHSLYSNHPDFEKLKAIPLDTPIVVYCSVGYRSEKMARKLKEMGFSNVFNLYGSIFEWVNEGHPIVNSLGQHTDTLHTFNKRWSRYVNNPESQKTW